MEELLARPFMDNVHPDDVESVGAVLDEVIARGTGAGPNDKNPGLRRRDRESLGALLDRHRRGD